MPAMDGYDFVRQLRCDASTAPTRVAFSAPTNVAADLDRLAESCGVEHILPTSCEAERTLEILTRALNAPAADPTPFVTASFDREYVHAIHARLIAKAAELRERDDIHEHLNEELRSSHRQYRALFELSPQPMSVYDRATGRIVAVNDASVANYGYSREEFLSMTLVDLVPLEDLGEFESYAARAAPDSGRGLTLARPWRHRLKNGSVIDVEVTSDDLTLDGRACRIVLCQDVTARKRAAAEVAAAHHAAVEASNLKFAFLANISHEMRTPMNGVMGMTDLLLGTELTPEQRAYAAQVARSGEDMIAIISDVLDVAKIETGGIVLDLADFQLRETLEQACATGVREAGAKGVRFELRFEDAVPQQAHGDAVRLGRILAHLVSNAVKFTAAGSVMVGVDAWSAPDSGDVRVRVEVADTGIGIDQAALERIFEPFTQVDTSMSRAYGGAGLGLSIARNLVALMDGRLGVDSRPGYGSRSWFELNLSPPVEGSERLPRPSPPALQAFSRRSSRAAQRCRPNRRRGR
jgi:PAS domain S-box-containing protein